MPWIDAGSADAIAPEEVIRFDHGARTFIIVRSDAGDYSCLDGLCSHEDVHLCAGLVIESTIECPKHASIFNVLTGEVETPPACENLRCYPTRVENGRVFVDL